MTAQYHSVFTEQGLSLLREAIQNGTKLGITKMSFGDGGGSLPIPDPSFTDLVSEVYQTQLNSLAPDPNNANWLRAEAVIASAVGGFNIRELGLWAGDILVAYSNYPPTYKPNPSDGTARIMTFRMVLQIDNTANFELKIDADIVMATIRTVEEAKDAAIAHAENLSKNQVKNVKEYSDLENITDPYDGQTIYVTSKNCFYTYSSDTQNWNEKILKQSFDVRDFGVIADRTTDWTSKIYEILEDIGEYTKLYIPPGVKWDYRQVFNNLRDFQTIEDDSGCDLARNVWQTSKYHWHRTNSNTEATSGNTQGIAGDYHPALFIDTWSNSPEGKRASVIFREKGIAKWQVCLDAADDLKFFSINEYGSQAYGTRKFCIGHQDGLVGGRVSFNAGLTVNSDSYTFGKPLSLGASSNFSTKRTRPGSDTGMFVEIWSYGSTNVYRQYIQKNGDVQAYTLNNKKITTTADGEYSGHLRKVADPTNTISLDLTTGGFISNYNTTAAKGVLLPKAVKGYAFEFSIDNDFELTITPNANDNFLGMDLGKGLKSNVVGSKLRIVAITSNIWSIEKVGTWVDVV